MQLNKFEMGNCLGQCLAGKNGLRYSLDEDEQDEDLVQNDGAEENFIYKIMKYKRKKRSQFLDKFWDRKDLTYSRLNQKNQTESSGIQLQCLDAQTLMRTMRDPQNNKYTSLMSDHGGIAASSSRASSSLDLEWEHEYGNTNSNIANVSWFFLPEEISINDQDKDSDCFELERLSNASMTNLTSTKNSLAKQTNGQSTNMNKVVGSKVISKGNWSHISTPESLEWDIDEEQHSKLRMEDDMLDHETLALLHEIETLKNRVLDETGDSLGIDLLGEAES